MRIYGRAMTDEIISARKIEVGPAEGGWRLRCPVSDLVLVFLSGAEAERQARQLARVLACQGETVQVLIRDRRNMVVGASMFAPDEDYRAVG